MKILLFGASGSIGSRIVSEATARGHRVARVNRALIARTGDEVPGDVRAPLDPLQAAAADAVVVAVGARASSDSPDYDVYEDAAAALVDAVRSLPQGSRPRMVIVGGAGSLQTTDGTLVSRTPGFPVALAEEAAAQHRALQQYRSVDDVSWTYLSPPAHLEPGRRTGRYRTGRDTLLTDERGDSTISIEDYAVALVDELERPTGDRARITVAY